MNEPRLKYFAELKLPNATNPTSIHFITADDFKTIDNQIRAACRAENVQPKLHSASGRETETTMFITDDSGEPLGEVVTYPSQTVNSRKQQKAA